MIACETRSMVMTMHHVTGLLPSNPERVLRDMPKLPTEITAPTADNMAETCSQDGVLHTPVTPVTPVTAEALTSLHNLIK